MKSNNVYIQNKFFCRSRSADVVKLTAYLTDNGFNIVDSPDIAHHIILLTCGAFNELTEESLKQVEELSKYNSNMIVTGCVPDTDETSLKNIYSGIVIRNADFNMLDEHFGKKYSITKYDEIETSVFDEELNLEICSGCTENCSYCAINKAIGKIQSKSNNYCIHEISNALKNGVKRIVISAENAGAYGSDIETNFTALLKSIILPKNTFILRINNLHPKYLNIHQEIIYKLNSECVIGMIKIPLQSGSQKILNKMRRNYKIVEIVKILKYLKQENEQLIIGTDIIIGFPGETDHDLHDTINLIVDANLDWGRVYLFAPKDGTDAATYREQITLLVKENRLNHLGSILKDRGYLIQKEPMTGFTFFKGDLIQNEENPYAVITFNMFKNPIS